VRVFVTVSAGGPTAQSTAGRSDQGQPAGAQYGELRASGVAAGAGRGLTTGSGIDLHRSGSRAGGAGDGPLDRHEGLEGVHALHARAGQQLGVGVRGVAGVGVGVVDEHLGPSGLGADRDPLVGHRAQGGVPVAVRGGAELLEGGGVHGPAGDLLGAAGGVREVAVDAGAAGEVCGALLHPEGLHRRLPGRRGDVLGVREHAQDDLARGGDGLRGQADSDPEAADHTAGRADQGRDRAARRRRDAGSAGQRRRAQRCDGGGGGAEQGQPGTGTRDGDGLHEEDPFIGRTGGRREGHAPASSRYTHSSPRRFTADRGTGATLGWRAYSQRYCARTKGIAGGKNKCTRPGRVRAGRVVVRWGGSALKRPAQGVAAAPERRRGGAEEQVGAECREHQDDDAAGLHQCRLRVQGAGCRVQGAGCRSSPGQGPV